MKLDPIAKRAIDQLAAEIRRLDDAVRKLQAVENQRFELTRLNFAPRKNGHLRLVEEAPDDGL